MPFFSPTFTRAGLLLAGLLASTLAAAEIQYTVHPDPVKKAFDVRIDLTATSSETEFRIPAWCPGYYTILAYQDHINTVEAKDQAGNTLKMDHSDERGWKVASTPGQTIHFSYRVLGNDSALGFFGSMMSNRVGYISGAATFMYVTGRKTEADQLKIEPPTGWDVVTALDKNDSGDYLAPTGYDELIDSPVQVGTFHREKITVEHIPFEVIFVTNGAKLACDPKVEAERLRVVSAPAIQMFHGAGFKHYTYLLHLDSGNFQGGLEHRACTCIDVPNDPHLDLDDLAAHENFHAWNVKQIRPFVLGPFDYTQPDRTGLLWWMEGVTDYYSKILTYRSGIDDSSWLLAQLSEQVAELQNSTNRLKITLEDCSRNCWENGAFGVGDLSFYTKGLLAGLILDASIRSVTKGEKSLDDVERLLFDRYHLPQPGMAENGVEKAIAEVVGSEVLSPLYRQMMQTTEEMPYDRLRLMGLQLEVPGKPYITASFTANKGVVVQVSGPGQDAGLKVGDKVISLAPVQIREDGQLAPTQEISIERGTEHMTIAIPVLTETGDRYQVLFDPSASSDAVKIRTAWLKRMK